MPNSQTGQSASDLIRRAMLTLGVLGSGETPEADEASDALDTLNDMLDAWDSDGLMIYTTRIDDFPITCREAALHARFRRGFQHRPSGSD
jgi:hypothetical protein